MELPNRTEIMISKGKMTKLLVYCVLFVIGGLWVIIADPQVSNSLINNKVLKTIIGLASVLMGGLGIYFFVKKMFDKEPGIVFSEEGILDNTTVNKFGLIPWEDISEIYERTVQVSLASKERFVTVKLIDPGKYIARERNLIKRKVLDGNSKHYGSPIHFSANGLKIDHKELLELAKAYLSRYQVADMKK